MKKILIVIDSLSRGGTEISLINMLNFISQFKQYSITLLPLVSNGSLISDVPSNINIIEIDKEKQLLLRPLRVQLKNNKSLLEKIKLLFTIIVYYKKMEKMQYGECIRCNLIRSLEENKQKFDVAIAYTDSSSLFYVADKVNATKKYVWVHMDYTQKNNRPVYHEQFYKKMDKIICVSHKAKQSFDTLNPSLSGKTDVIHNLLDIKRIDKLKTEKVEEFNRDYFNVLSVGRLNPEKNFSNLITVFNDVSKNVSKRVRLYILGAGPEEKKLRQLVVDNRMEDKCFLLGEKSNPYKYMNNCDLYVQTSYREGFGMTLYEAKYLKKAILSTKVSATDEIFINGKNAIIVENNNEEIYIKLNELIENDYLREELKKHLEDEKLIDDKKKIIEILSGD